jgi:hypothetical protein
MHHALSLSIICGRGDVVTRFILLLSADANAMQLCKQGLDPEPQKFTRPPLIWRLLIWLVIPALCACVPLVVNYYQPRSAGDVQSIWGGCSLAPGLVLTLHLPAHVNVDVHPVAKSTGIESALTIAFDVPAGTVIRLAEPTVMLGEGPSTPAVTLKVDRIHKPRTLVNGQADYLEPGEAMPGPARYGIAFDLPQRNSRELIVKPPPLIIDGQRVDVEAVEFVLKKHPHLACLT